jgi:hypothetical protein
MGPCRSASAKSTAGPTSPPPTSHRRLVAVLSVYGDLKILSEQHIWYRTSEGQATARVRAKGTWNASRIWSIRIHSVPFLSFAESERASFQDVLDGLLRLGAVY